MRAISNVHAGRRFPTPGLAHNYRKVAFFANLFSKYLEWHEKVSKMKQTRLYKSTMCIATS